MSDLGHEFGGDLQLSNVGDLLAVDGLLRGQQRIIRRLMTILGEYIFRTDYGASVPKRIGDTVDTTLIASIVRSQIFLEEAVARSPDPIILIAPILDGVHVRIIYTDSSDGQQLELSFEVAP